MNQILSVEMPQKNKKKKKSSVNSILIVFAVFLMIFGIGLTSTGAYAYYKNISNKQEEKMPISNGTKPVITTERESSSVINIVVTHDKEISNITYKINDGEEIKIDVGGKQKVTERVELPIGSSSINITAKDINGVNASYQSTFEAEQKPQITLKQEGKQIMVKVTSKIDIKDIKCYWDDDLEEADFVNVEEFEYLEHEVAVDVIEGTHTLNVVATDIEGNETTKTQKIVGDTKPELKVTTDGLSFIINATDDENLDRIEIKLNENDLIAEKIDEKEYTKNIDLEDGENKLIVTVYNINGLSETSRVKYTK